MTTRFEAVIFDMDGLLVDSERIWLLAEIDMMAERGEEYTPEVRETLVGLRLDEFSEKIKAVYGFEESAAELEAELIARMLKRIPDEVMPQAGAPEIVAYVAESGLPTCIASSSPQSIIDAIIEGQGWSDVFHTRVSADTVARGKPAPDVYLKAAEVLGVKPEACLALEDSPNGARAAVAAGMTCYAVPDPTHSDQTAFEGITPHVFPSLHEVASQLKGV